MTSPKIELYNKRARFDYEIKETYEAGISLTGEEIKAIRAHRVSMNNSYAKVMNGEVFWLGGNFNMAEGDKQRIKKLLLHKEEISRLIGLTAEKGATLVPIKLYMKKGKAKIELGVGYGKKKYDKRETIKRREQEIEIQRQIKR